MKPNTTPNIRKYSVVCALRHSRGAENISPGFAISGRVLTLVNVELKVKKACIAYNACKKTSARKSGVRSRMVLGMYTVEIRPILAYGSIMW